MPTLNNSFFFKDLYLSIENSCNNKQFEQFSALNNDEERFQFLHDFNGSKLIKELNFNLNKNELNQKDETIAFGLKKKGNLAFQAQHWIAALEMYNQCYRTTPTENVKDISIILANRSAALYHMEMYDLAINDMDLAMPNYPMELMYKIKERKAKCLLAKKDLRLALQCFQETISCLDKSGLTHDKRAKLEQDAQIMIKMLMIDLEKSKKRNDKLNNGLNKLKNKNIKNMIHESVEFEYNENEGHFAVAKKEIKIGEQILIQQPHCFSLLEKYCKTHCQNCFQKTIAPLPCPTCSNVIFCSKVCRDVALASYHKYECSILPILWNSGTSLNCHLAIRMIVQHNLDFFLNLKNELKNGITFENTLKLPSSDYRKVFNLVRHENKRDGKSFFHYTVMSYFLAHCLKSTGYFIKTTNKNEKEKDEEDFYYIGSLILRNLQFLQFNAHEISELQGNNKLSKTGFIGGGLYPTLALFNHSCNPSIVRYFKGTTVIVNAIGITKAGDMIAENYGPIYSQDPVEKRNSTLNEIYWFKCNCLACKEDWPLYDEMNQQLLRFKCDGDNPCNNVLQIPIDTDAFMVKCNGCGQFTNILKGLKAMQDTDILNKTATRYFDGGEFNKAMHKYIEMLTIMETIMAPPFRDYCNCQQSIKDCLLQFGNK